MSMNVAKNVVTGHQMVCFGDPGGRLPHGPSHAGLL